MIDTHCHLFDSQFDLDRDECLKRCKEDGVNRLIVVGFSLETNEQAYKLASLDSNYFPTAGLHPDEADSNYLEKFNKLKEFLLTHKVYAIGECGLDYHYGKEFIEEQKSLLRLQCELAVEMNLPIIIHMRDATLDTYNILEEFKGKLRGVMHCYSGSLEFAYKFMELGFYISLGGPVTFKNAKESVRVLENIPLDRLLLETDCPYLAPVPMRGKRNESSFVKYTYDHVAKIKNMDLKELEMIVDKNADSLFELK